MALFAAVRVKGADGLRKALEQARAADRATVVTVEIDPDPLVGTYDGWWDVPIAEVSSEASVNAARADYEEAIKNQRVVWQAVGQWERGSDIAFTNGPISAMICRNTGFVSLSR